MTSFLANRQAFIQSLRRGTLEPTKMQGEAPQVQDRRSCVIHDANPVEPAVSREQKMAETKKKTRRRLKKDYIVFAV